MGGEGNEDLDLVAALDLIDDEMANTTVNAMPVITYSFENSYRYCAACD